MWRYPLAAFQKDRSCSPVLSLPVDPGMGLVSGAHRPVPGGCLPESLPAIFFPAAFRTFTFKGGDGERCEMRSPSEPMSTCSQSAHHAS